MNRALFYHSCVAALILSGCTGTTSPTPEGCIQNV